MSEASVSRATDDLQEMVNRMTLNGMDDGGPSVDDIAVALQDRLQVGSLGHAQYLQLANMFIQLNIQQQEQQQQQHQQQQQQLQAQQTPTKPSQPPPQQQTPGRTTTTPVAAAPEMEEKALLNQRPSPKHVSIGETQPSLSSDSSDNSDGSSNSVPRSQSRRSRGLSDDDALGAVAPPTKSPVRALHHSPTNTSNLNCLLRSNNGFNAVMDEEVTTTPQQQGRFTQIFNCKRAPVLQEEKKEEYIQMSRLANGQFAANRSAETKPSHEQSFAVFAGRPGLQEMADPTAETMPAATAPDHPPASLNIPPMGVAPCADDGSPMASGTQQPMPPRKLSPQRTIHRGWKKRVEQGLEELGIAEVAEPPLQDSTPQPTSPDNQSFATQPPLPEEEADDDVGMGVGGQAVPSPMATSPSGIFTPPPAARVPPADAATDETPINIEPETTPGLSTAFAATNIDAANPGHKTGENKNRRKGATPHNIAEYKNLAKLDTTNLYSPMVPATTPAAASTGAPGASNVETPTMAVDEQTEEVPLWRPTSVPEPAAPSVGVPSFFNQSVPQPTEASTATAKAEPFNFFGSGTSSSRRQTKLGSTTKSSSRRARRQPSNAEAASTAGSPKRRADVLASSSSTESDNNSASAAEMEIDEPDANDMALRTPPRLGKPNTSVGFQMGTGPQQRSRRPGFRKPLGRGFPKTSATNPIIVPSDSEPELRMSGSSSSESQPKKGPAEADVAAELQALLTSLKDEARAHYMKGDYRSSILRYTQAIQQLSASPVRFVMGDLLAVLYSNRAAALMMLGAFAAAADDCRQGLKHVSGLSPSGENFSKDSGPPLQVKLYTRLARAFLKLGDAGEAKTFFDEAVRIARESIIVSERVHTRSTHEKHKSMLEQMSVEAQMGKSEAIRLIQSLEKVGACVQQVEQDPSGRRIFAEALGHVNVAMTIAPGSVDLYEAEVKILAKMKRWREAAGFCERLAALHVKMDSIFVLDLETKAPFPVTNPAVYLVSDFFREAREEDASTAELKLNSKSAAEAVVRMPFSLMRFYVRALRLEERYPAAEACLNVLEHLATHGTHHFPILLVQERLSWLPQERNKLNRTKSGREKGDELFRLGDFQLASAHYANCLNIDAEDESTDSLEGLNAGGRLHAVLHCNRAACLMAMRRYEDALDECTSALRIHSRYMKAMLRRARCYSRLLRFQEAISEYRRWLELVEEAKKSASSVFVTPCLFDGPRDVKEADVVVVNNELEGVYAAKRKSEAAAREENSRRQQRQRWQDDYSANSQSWNGSNSNSAKQRRENWYGSQSSRRWDSFRGQGPRSNSSGRRRGSWQENNGAEQDRQYGSGQQRRPRAGESPRSALSVPDHYNVLEVGFQASEDEIKKAYRKMALKYHPDKNKDPNAADLFRKIKLAYETLGDAASRQQYNAEMGYHRRRN